MNGSPRTGLQRWKQERSCLGGTQGVGAAETASDVTKLAGPSHNAGGSAGSTHADGTVARLASRRAPRGIAAGDIWTSWLNPTSLYCGLLAVGICAYLAAVYFIADARRADADILVTEFRRRALATGAVVGFLALGGLGVPAVDAPALLDRLFGTALRLVIMSVTAGAGSLVLTATGHYRLIRATAALAVAGMLWAWGVAQYPLLLAPDLTVAEAAGAPAVLTAVLGALAVGAVLLVPSLWWLFSIFQHQEQRIATRHLFEHDCAEGCPRHTVRCPGTSLSSNRHARLAVHNNSLGSAAACDLDMISPTGRTSVPTTRSNSRHRTGRSCSRARTGRPGRRLSCWCTASGSPWRRGGRSSTSWPTGIA